MLRKEKATGHPANSLDGVPIKRRVQMDIFRFIDSADIRRYLVKIQYRFSTEEKMLLIWYCKSATLNEKIAAWQEIVGYVPSCPWDDAWDIRERVAARFGILREMAQQPGPHTGKNACQRRCQRHDLQWRIHHVGRPGRDYTVCVSRSSSP